ncbi:hypothetical protein ACI7RC_27430 [Brevibacillus sp. B_LB10_24]|uniref:hypothetical protein n=1 Tax=Brevibacillus sp. B_LB10_24 TaxID=3380645 RepID=UPI0038BC6800
MGFFDRLSGKDVTEKIEEYSEVYGQILLGMHEKLESMEKDLVRYKDITSEVNAVRLFEENRIKLVHEIQSLQEQLHHSIHNLETALQTVSQDYQKSMKALQIEVKTLDERTNILQNDYVTLQIEFHERESDWQNKIKKRDIYSLTGFSILICLTLLALWRSW